MINEPDNRNRSLTDLTWPELLLSRNLILVNEGVDDLGGMISNNISALDEIQIRDRGARSISNDNVRTDGPVMWSTTIKMTD